MHLIHIITGIIIFVATSFYGLKIIEYFAWNVHPDYHQIMGCATLGLVFFLSLLGILTVLI